MLSTSTIPEVPAAWTVRPFVDAYVTDQAQFDRLLEWLDPDREQAGIRYEAIRRKLIQLFCCRGSHISEELTDRTFDRVIRKLPKIQATYSGDPAHYFLGVAANIFRESWRKERFPVRGMPDASLTDAELEQDCAYLEECIEGLPAEDRELVLTYYEQDKGARIENRMKLADKLGLTMNALRIRAHRIRLRLFQSMERRGYVDELAMK